MWRQKQGELRKGTTVDAGGDYIAPGWNSASKLAFDGIGGTAIVWVEGVRRSSSAGSDRVVVRVDPDGAGASPATASDAVRLTVATLDVVSIGGPYSPRGLVPLSSLVGLWPLRDDLRNDDWMNLKLQFSPVLDDSLLATFVWRESDDVVYPDGSSAEGLRTENVTTRHGEMSVKALLPGEFSLRAISDQLGFSKELVIHAPDVGRISEGEAALFHPAAAWYAGKGAKDQAELYEQSFPGAGTDSTQANAMKHAHWSALIAMDYGGNVAKELTTAHEYNSRRDYPVAARTTVMDLHNNTMGRAAAAEVLTMERENSLPEGGQAQALDQVLRRYWSEGLLWYFKPGDEAEMIIRSNGKRILQ